MMSEKLRFRTSVPGHHGIAGDLLDVMPPKTTKRWVPINRNSGSSGGRDSALPVVPLHQGVVVPATSTMRWVPVNRAGGASSSRGREGGDPDADRLSALPDALLHHILSFLKAWEVVRTCVLSRRWHHLWQSVPCVDLRAGQDDYDGVPEDFPDFARRLFRRRDATAALDTLRLRSSNVDGAHNEDDARLWIRTAIKRGARVIHLVGHRRMDWLHGGRLATLEHSSFVSCHLKVLKLSYTLLDDNILRQLSCHCLSLEELDLKDCMITGHEILSASLKILTMFKCQINANLSIAALNLVQLRCISPITQAPSFQNRGSLVAGTIILDDYSFSDDFEDFSKDDLAETSDEDDDNHKYKTGYGFGDPAFEHGFKADYEYGSDIESDDNTYEYSDIADDSGENSFDGDGHSCSTDGNRHVPGENSGCNKNQIKGGYNILRIFSNATSLELLAGAGEVILTRELKSCPSFINLKTLSLGEWSMAADFDPLLLLLQRSPNLEKLFLELKLVNVRKPMEIGVKPNGRSFSCKHLQMVKIKCSKDDIRVHKLAWLFKANGVSVEKIFVRRTGSASLRSKKTMKDLARHELEFWGDNDFWGDY